MAEDHIWEIRNPDGGAMGLEFTRGRMAEHERVLAHALPERIDVEVRTPDGRVVAGRGAVCRAIDADGPS